jgi:uncharacterized membrane protein YraQ (UPF0718 family)
MFTHILDILDFMVEALLHIWPYLVITIPIAVAVGMTDISDKIKGIVNINPLLAILVATLVGAISPFCSCGVIPVIWALLTAGVPIAPVMSFWLASPSMDPEIFFLSVSTLGWKLAVWRLAGTFVLSLSGGIITHVAVQRNWLGKRLLRTKPAMSVPGMGQLVQRVWQSFAALWETPRNVVPNPDGTLQIQGADVSCGCGAEDSEKECIDSDINDRPIASESTSPRSDFASRLLSESKSAIVMVVKFMALALFLEALIVLYVPQEWIVGLVGQGNIFAVPLAALLAVPVYTTSLAALAMIGGLLEQGMHPGAALAFLIAGPTTTLPAMVAVWGLANRRIFAVYLLMTLFGALLIGLLYF